MIREKIGNFLYSQEYAGGQPLSESQAYFKLKFLANDFYSVSIPDATSKPFNIGQLLFGAKGWKGCLVVIPTPFNHNKVSDVSVFIEVARLNEQQVSLAFKYAKILLDRVSNG